MGGASPSTDLEMLLFYWSDEYLTLFKTKFLVKYPEIFHERDWVLNLSPYEP